MKAADPKYCTGRIMAIKKGVNHSNNKERCSAGNLDDLLWKYCKLRYTNLSCSDVHWNFWRMCNALRLGSEVYDWYRLLHRFGEEGAQVFKKSLQFLFCILLPACVLLSVCSLQSAFYTQSAVMRTANDGAHHAQVTQYTFMMTHWISAEKSCTE